MGEIKEFLWRVAVTKAVKRLAQLIASFLLANMALDTYGAHEPEITLVVTALLNSILEIWRNGLKQNFPKLLGWL